MEGYRARRDGREFTVSSLEELYQLAARGQLGPGDEVWSDGAWVPASSLPELRARRGSDPWDAWSDLDEVDAESAYNAYVQGAVRPVVAPPPPRAPARAPVVDPFLDGLEPDDEPTPKPWARPPEAARVKAAPVAVAPPEPSASPWDTAPARPTAPPTVPASEPPVQAPPEPVRCEPPREAPRSALLDDLEASVRPAGGTRGEVIDFPRTRKPAPYIPPTRERASPTPPLVRPLRVGVWVLLGVAVLSGAWYWMHFNATSTAGMDVVATPAPTVHTPKATTDLTNRTAVPVASALEDVTKELRAGLTGEVRPIHEDAQLGDALLIDLQHLNTDVLTVDAPILDWAGRDHDRPGRVEIHARLTPRDPIARQLGAVGLVVGRYIRALGMKVDVLEVVFHTDEGDKAITLDPRACEDYYVGRVTLEQLLEASVAAAP